MSWESCSGVELARPSSVTDMIPVANNQPKRYACQSRQLLLTRTSSAGIVGVNLSLDEGQTQGMLAFHLRVFSSQHFKRITLIECRIDAEPDSAVQLRFFTFEHVLVDAVEGMTAQVCLYSN